MARMRLISEAFRQLKEDDPSTAITFCSLRRIVVTGAIPSLMVGRKRLIDYDKLLDYLNGLEALEAPSEDTGTIRQVKV